MVMILMLWGTSVEARSVDRTSVGSMQMEIELVEEGPVSRPVLHVKKQSQVTTRTFGFEPVKFVNVNGRTHILGKADGEMNLYRVHDPSQPPTWVKRVKDPKVAH